MAHNHFPDTEAEYCLAEGGNVTREGGKVKVASVQTLEKIPRAIELTARGVAGHGSVPLKTNAVARLSTAVGKVAAWKPPITINETTGTYFRRMASISSPEQAKHYRQLRYLATRHEHTILKLRFVLSPFSFVFLLAGEEQFHIVL